jgi:tetratricopeptide (TPR) repeat protein
MNQNHEILVDYLDGHLSPEVSAEVKNRVKQDKEFAGELEYFRLAVDTVRQDALRQQVSAIRNSFENNLIVSQRPSGAIIRSMYRTSLRVAAILILVAGISFMYKYLTVSSLSVFEKQFNGYELSTTRGQEKADQVAEAYRNKNWKEVILNYQSETVPSNKSRFLTGMAEMQQDHFPQAITIFENLLLVNHTNGTDSFQDETEYYLSLAYLKNHDVEKAVQLINKIKADPGHRYYPVISNISSIDLKIIELKK